MKIITARGSGFCFGVKRAMDMAYKYTEKHGKEGVFSLHEIIHNPQEVERLERAGARHADTAEDIGRGSRAIISTHGITPAEERLLKEKCSDVLDTTCPYVKRIHNIVRTLVAEKYRVVIAGDRDHLEVKGILGYAGDDACVVSTVAEAAKMKLGGKIGLVAQTTQNQAHYRDITCELLKNAFRERQSEVRVFNTICDATETRQDAVVALAKRSDVMIIIGGKNSANTRRLFELSRKVRPATHHIESEKELKKAWFKGMKTAGVSAGASTPERVIRAVVAGMKKMGEKSGK